MSYDFLDFNPNKSDVNDLKKTWKEVFLDSDFIIDSFFSNIYKPEQSFVIKEGGKAVSVLYLLDASISILKKEYPAFYLYAAATTKEHRQKGHMAKLLSIAKAYAINCGKDFIALYPAEDSLYDYYKKFGYQPVFKTKEVEIKGSSIRILKSKDCKIKNLEVKDFYDIRKKALEGKDALIWPQNILSFQKELIDEYEGKAFAAIQDNVPIAYVIADQNKNQISIKEALSVDGNLSSIAAILDEKFDFEEYALPFPMDFHISADNMRLKNGGMALSLSKEAENITERINTLYMGLNLG